jgi:hypothetical protein
MIYDNSKPLSRAEVKHVSNSVYILSAKFCALQRERQNSEKSPATRWHKGVNDENRRMTYDKSKLLSMRHEGGNDETPQRSKISPNCCQCDTRAGMTKPHNVLK